MSQATRLAPAPLPGRLQLDVDRWAAIGPPTRLRNGADALTPLGIGPASGGLLSPSPSRVVRTRDPEHTTGEGDRVRSRMGRDEPVATHRVVLSRAKNAA